MSLPTIFLQNTPTSEFWDSTDIIFNNLPLLFSQKSQRPRFGLDFSTADPMLGPKIDTVTRVELPVQQLEPIGYGLYSYLLFGSNSEAGKQRRYAASRAYCKNIPPLQEAIREGYATINLNLFIVPTKDVQINEEYCHDSEKLVNIYYDYTRAKKILYNIGIKGDGIYLVACSGALLTHGKCDPHKTLVVELGTVKERLIELCVLEFRSQTRKQKYWNDMTLRSLLLSLRLKLPDVAEFIKFAEAVAAER
jgi:hypothetical protein